jgi:Icc-related predicted phosphoesterase
LRPFLEYNKVDFTCYSFSLAFLVVNNQPPTPPTPIPKINDEAILSNIKKPTTDIMTIHKKTPNQLILLTYIPPFNLKKRGFFIALLKRPIAEEQKI